MSNNATEQMLLAVKTTKEGAEKAERDYDRAAQKLQEMAGHSINLFGGTAISQVANLASESRRICDALYASYQTLVTMLDSTCRPLLQQGPELPAVRAVRDLIKWLNDESEIENNFTASLNSNSLGEVASVRYVPSMENKMIQSFWEQTYRALPGRQELEGEEKEAADREKKQAAAIRKAKYEETVKREQLAEEQYREKLETWRATAAEAEKKRAEMISKLESAERAKLEAELRDRCEAAVTKLEAECKKCQAEMEETQQLLSTLGFFQFGEKRQQKKNLENLRIKLAKTEEMLKDTRQNAEEERRGITAKINGEKKKWKRDAEKSYPIPAEPCRPGMTPDDIKRQKLKDTILTTLRKHKDLTVEELYEKCPAINDCSKPQVQAMLRLMQAEERVAFYEAKYKRFYYALPEKSEEERRAEEERYVKAIYDYVQKNGRCSVESIAARCSKVNSLENYKVDELAQKLYARGDLHWTRSDEMSYYEPV